MTENRVAVITGANSGIGAAVARRLRDDGWKLGLIARNEARLLKVARGLDPTGEEVVPISADVRERTQLGTAMRVLIEHDMRPQVCVAAAGHGRGYGALISSDADAWSHSIETNLIGIAYTLQAFLQATDPADQAHAVVVGSIFATASAPNYAPYVAAKHGVLGLLRSIRPELPNNIRLTLVNPGTVHTAFASVILDRAPETLGTDFWPYTPLSADDVANAVHWLLHLPQHVEVTELTIRPTGDRTHGG